MREETYIIVLAEPYDAPALARLETVGRVIAISPGNEDALRAELAQADALLVRSYTRVDESLLAMAPRLKVIARGGIGLDNIDVEAARRRGIPVVYTPEASTRAVAEFTMGLIVALERRIVEAAKGEVVTPAEQRLRCIGRELHDLTLGIVGLGRVGKAVASIAYHGFGMKIIYNDIVDMGWFSFVARRVSKEELWESADVISLHVPLTEQTRRLCDAAVFRRMRPDATLINTARGAVVETETLVEALSEGRVAGAALDVTDPEPLPHDHPLLGMSRVIVTPHIAARTHTGLANMNAVVEDVIAVLQGRAARYSA